MRWWRLWLAICAVLLMAGLVWTLRHADTAFAREQALARDLRVRNHIAAMETALTLFLQEEEAHPASHYRYFYVPDRLVPGSVALRVSPLAPYPPSPPIACYLRLAPDGSIASSHLPEDPELARATGWQDDPTLRRRLDLLRAGLQVGDQQRQMASAAEAAALAEARQRVLAPQADAGISTSPADELGEDAARFERRQTDRSSTAVSSRPAAAEPQPARGIELQQDLAEASQSEMDADGVGARSQGGRGKLQLPAQTVYNFAEETQENVINRQLRHYQFNDGSAEGFLQPDLVAQAVQERLDVDPEASVEIGALRSRVLPDGSWLLLRTVTLPDATVQQGFQIEREALQEHLAAGLGEAIDAGLQLQWDASGPGCYRFAPPFQELRVRILPPPTATDGRRAWLWSLGGMLALIGLLVFLGVERLISVRLAWIRRRQNFVAAVSHELKTPLTAIRMYAEMLGAGMVVDESQRQDYYRTIQAESERLSRMIGNVLELSRLERGAVQVHLQVGPVAPVLEELQRVLDPHLREQGFRLEVTGAATAPAALFDRECLLQVLLNACDNAMKFAAEAEDRRIVISLEQLDEGLHLRIRDYGPGAPATALRRCFDSFYRAGDEQTRRHKGSGIGLALVRGLVERMRGQVSAINASDGGFELRIDLACC